MATTEPTTDTVPPRWGLGDAAAGWLIAQTMAVLSAAALLPAFGALQPVGQALLDIVGEVTGTTQEAPFTPLWLVAVLQLFLWVGLLGVPVFAARVKGNGVVSDFGLRFRWVDLPVGAAIGLLCQLVLVPAVSYPWLWLLGRDASELEEAAREITDKATDPVGVVLLVLIVVVGAPLVEEVFFRGLLQRSLLRSLPAAVAIAGSSLLFALTHFQLLQFPALFAFGVVLGFLAWRTGRLGTAVCAHVAFNAVTVFSLLVLG